MDEQTKRTIAVDFDGTLCINDWPEIGRPRWSVLKRMAREFLAGADIVLYTMREGKALDDAIKMVQKWMYDLGMTNFKFAAVNDNTEELKEKFGNNPRKVYADEYWDDHNVRLNRANDRVEKELLERTMRQHCQMWRWIAAQTVRERRKVEKWEYFYKIGMPKGIRPLAFCWFCDRYDCEKENIGCLLYTKLPYLCRGKGETIFNRWDTTRGKEWEDAAFLALEMAEGLERWAMEHGCWSDDWRERACGDA